MSLRCVTGANSIGGLIASAYPGLGIRGDSISALGSGGASPVYPMLSLPADAAKEYRIRSVTALTSGASVQTYEDLSAAVTPPSGMVNGKVFWSFVLHENGASLGTSVQTIVVGTVTTWAAGSDVSANGWTPSTGASLASCIDEASLSRSDWITSPNLTAACTLAWSPMLPAGAYEMILDAAYIGSSGKARIVCLDAGGATVGTSPWQTLTGSDATYSLIVSTSADSTQFRIEVQA
jgi:hypothetical protein